MEYIDMSCKRTAQLITNLVFFAHKSNEIEILNKKLTSIDVYCVLYSERETKALKCLILMWFKVEHIDGVRISLYRKHFVKMQSKLRECLSIFINKTICKLWTLAVARCKLWRSSFCFVAFITMNDINNFVYEKWFDAKGMHIKNKNKPYNATFNCHLQLPFSTKCNPVNM